MLMLCYKNRAEFKLNALDQGVNGLKMTRILADHEIRKLITTGIISDGDEESIKSNSYILRLGSEGEFINVEKEFSLGKGKLGIKVAPGHSVGLIAHENIDFRSKKVEKVFPGCALHAFISPTTDLSREGIVAPTTQVDAGFKGTLNWTINNTGSKERAFEHLERIFRITFFLLEENEVPEKYYTGDYHGKHGYTASQRSGPSNGIRTEQWEDCHKENDPESLLAALMKSGYPWNLFGDKLAEMSQQYKSMLTESSFDERYDSMVKDMQLKWVVTLIFGVVGLASFVGVLYTIPPVIPFITNNLLGVSIFGLTASLTIFALSRTNRRASK